VIVTATALHGLKFVNGLKYHRQVHTEQVQACEIKGQEGTVLPVRSMMNEERCAFRVCSSHNSPHSSSDRRKVRL
jgi:hypothetical protein